ncbi:MAG: type II toxin-antitoxin system VapC family toxin [Chloroflexi bacterium]|nr:type II toxin-antitoxin system VapC family toxin [Chloroflexota bacterium]
MDLLLPGPLTPRIEGFWKTWLEQGVDCVAPPLFQAETTSVLRNRVYRNVITFEEAVPVFRTIRRLAIRFVNYPDLQEQAWDIALRLNQPRAYDAQYLAVAEREGCEFWTTDSRLYNSVHGTLPWVQLVTP